MTIIDILTQGKMSFAFDESSYALMEQMQLPETQLARVRSNVKKTEMIRSEVDAFLQGLFPNPKKHTTNRRIILEAGAITAYLRHRVLFLFLQ